MRRTTHEELYEGCTTTTIAFDDPLYLFRPLSQLMLGGAGDGSYSFQGTWLCAI